MARQRLRGRGRLDAAGLIRPPREMLELEHDLRSNDALTSAPELRNCLGELLADPSFRVASQEWLKAGVYRLQVDAGDTRRLLVVKWSDPVVARRSWLVARRWLPAVGLEEKGPPLLALAAARTGQGAWHVYEDLRGHPLATERPHGHEVKAAIEAIAHVHAAFADHDLLPECRLWGGDRGISFYLANLHDSVTALRSLEFDRDRKQWIAARDALLERIEGLIEQEPERARALSAWGGAETLLHGDLWPSNAVVIPNGEEVRVRLIDWDEAAVGPIGFDLSTFLLRFDASDRRWILDAYRRAVDRLAGWTLPEDRDLNVVFATAAYARLASLLVWSVAAARDGESDWLLERLAAIAEWLDAVEPVLPAR